VSYRPGIFYFDSWLYLGVAEHGHPVAFAPDRPSGYPLLLKLGMSALGGLSTVTALQQLAGLGVGVVVWTLTRRLGVGKRLALAATALVVLDGSHRRVTGRLQMRLTSFTIKASAKHRKHRKPPKHTHH
jgi:hypothetical protein